MPLPPPGRPRLRLAPLLALLLLAGPARPISFQLPGKARKCLREEIHRDTLVTGEYEIGAPPGSSSGPSANLKVRPRRRPKKRAGGGRAEGGVEAPPRCAGPGRADAPERGGGEAASGRRSVREAAPGAAAWGERGPARAAVRGRALRRAGADWHRAGGRTAVTWLSRSCLVLCSVGREQWGGGLERLVCSRAELSRAAHGA